MQNNQILQNVMSTPPTRILHNKTEISTRSCLFCSAGNHPTVECTSHLNITKKEILRRHQKVKDITGNDHIGCIDAADTELDLDPRECDRHETVVSCDRQREL